MRKPKWVSWRWWVTPLPGFEDGRSLPWSIFDREVRPYSLAVSLATFAVTISIFTGGSVGSILDGGFAQAMIGGAAAATTGLLWYGWWGRSKKHMTDGLLLAAAVWSAVGAEIALEGVSWTSAVIAWCWVVASGGAWLLEVNDPGFTGR